jgi:hypothetical protein
LAISIFLPIIVLANHYELQNTQNKMTEEGAGSDSNAGACFQIRFFYAFS